MNGHRLSLDEQHLLDNVVIENAKRWVNSFAPGSSLFEHGRNTLEHWGADTDHDVSGALSKAKAASEAREAQRRERADW
jgi:hypothetical protein